MVFRFDKVCHGFLALQGLFLTMSRTPTFHLVAGVLEDSLEFKCPAKGPSVWGSVIIFVKGHKSDIRMGSYRSFPVQDSCAGSELLDLFPFRTSARLLYRVVPYRILIRTEWFVNHGGKGPQFTGV